MNDLFRKAMLLLLIIAFILLFSLIFHNLFLIGESNLKELSNDPNNVLPIMMSNAILGVILYGISFFISEEKKKLRKVIRFVGIWNTGIAGVVVVILLITSI